MELTSLCTCLFLVLIQCAFSNFCLGSVISVEDNGYKGIVVAIHSRVPEDLEIINNIKTLFSKASEFLYNSTRQSFYFKEVKIIVPPTWSEQPEYEILPGYLFSNAHVRVDEPNPEYKNTPYTVQPGGCGESGQYVHLTPWFVKELNGETVEMFGAPERQLVHEWAHFRYGVFDEYGMPGDKRYPMFYHENGKVRPTSCVRDIKGWIESRDGGPCTMTSDGEVDIDCIFIPNMHSSEAKASIMYMPFIPSMEGFCDDSTHRHNVLAPTKHNALCHYRSTWDVISHHSDFQKRTKRDTGVAELTETLFRVIQSPKNPTSRIVLVLDVSGSMNGQPMKMLHSAATRLVEDRIPDNTYLGIVQFSTTARILHNLTKVDNVTRVELSRSLPSKDDDGRTAIGLGLQEAIKVLKFANGTAEGGLIMLITDGEENIQPFIEEVLPSVLENDVIINAVAFGSEASDKLENMTTITGGRGYFFSYNGSRSTSALDSAFLESITSQADVELQPVQLKDEVFTLDEKRVIKHVYVDKELGKETTFTITSPHLNRIEDVSIMSPSGDVFDSVNPKYNRDDNVRQRIQILLPEAEPGRWAVTISRRDSYPIAAGLSVTSQPKDIRDQPIRVRSWLNEIQLKFPAYAKVYAEVKKGYMAVVGATVVATIERPMGQAVDIELKDNGLGADVTENDGIYSAYFTQFHGNGRYAVIARVTNDGQARLKKGSVASASQPMPVMRGGTKDVIPTDEFFPESFEPSDVNEATETAENDTEPASKFDRAANTGVLRLESWTPDSKDSIPPGDVMDLTVIFVETTAEEENRVTLQFTVPGNDMDKGQVHSLEMRASRSKEELLKEFETGVLIDDTFIANGSLTPLPPGEQIVLTVIVPKNLTASDGEPWTVYFAVKAKDEEGSVSSKFNFAEATFGIMLKSKETKHIDETLEEDSGDHNKEITEVNKEENPSESTLEIKGHENDGKKTVKNEDEENSSHDTPGNSSFKWWPVAVGTGVAIAVIMIIVLLAVLILKKTKMKTYFSVQSEPC